MNTTGPRHAERLTIGSKLGYGVAGFGDSALYGVFVSFYLYFLTDVAHIVPVVAGTLITIGIAWDAITDPLIGVISDNSTYKFGRRRPYMLAIALPLGISSWLIFTDLGLGPFWTHCYHLVALLFYFFAYTIFYVPWTALGAEVTTDYNERSGVMSVKMGWAALGAVLGGAVPLMLVGYFRGVSGSEKMGWSAMAATIGLIATGSVFLSWRATRGLEIKPEEMRMETHKWSDHLRDMPGILRSNRPFRYVVGLFSFGVMAEGLSASYLVYFSEYYMGLTERQISLLFLLYMSAGFLWLPVLNYVAQRFGKRHAYAFFVGAWAAGYLLTLFFVTPGRFALFCALRVLTAGGWAAIWALGWAMISDVIEVDEFKTGRRREGLYFGVIQFLQKLSAGLVLAGGGLVLTLIGYVPNVEQSETSIMGIRLTFCLGVSFLLASSIFLAIMYPMTKAKHDALREAIGLKKEGREANLELIEDIID
jgi:GPH family glycoside/pentoside/hexuronide:cation symporter